MRLVLGLLIVAEAVVLMGAPRPSEPVPPAVAAPSPVAPRIAIAGPKLTYMQRLQREVEALRGLRFKHDVVVEKRTRKQLHKYLREQLAKEDMGPEEVMLKAFGLIPPESSLRELILRLYTAQVAGFYEPTTQRFYMIEDRSTSMLGSLTGRISSTMDVLNGTSEIVMIHELDHALTDQQFNLDKFEHSSSSSRKPSDNDDEDIARQAVVEGDATMVMIHAQWRQMGLDFGQPLDGEALERVTDMLSWLPGMSQQGLDEAPLYLRRRLIFPYFYGAGFMDAMKSVKQLDKAYTSPPRSTAQILHPILYREHEEPLQTPKDVLPTDVGGWHLQTSNVFGEFRMNVFFEQYLKKASDHAAGWRGDRYWIYTHGADYAILAGSTWMDALAARYDAQRFTYYMVKRYRLAVTPEMQRMWHFSRGEEKAKWSAVRDGRLYAVEVDGKSVRIQDGVPPALAAQWRATRLVWTSSKVRGE